MVTFPAPFRAAILTAAGALVVGAVSLSGAGSALAALPSSGETVMTSVDPSTTPVESDKGASASTVSADGRYVAFTSGSTNLVAIGNHAVSQVYKRDLVTGQTTLVSVGLLGTESGDKASLEPSISADGRYVAFTSASTNLALPADAGNTFKQIFVRDTVSLTTLKVSLKPGLLAGGHEDSGHPSISADGALVAFQSGANDLVTGITPTETEIYIAKNAADPRVRLVNARNGTVDTLADHGAVNPSISGDGSTVVFASNASNIVATTGRGFSQIYARSLGDNSTRRVSVDRTDPSIAGDDSSDNPAVSFNGFFVAFESEAINLVPQDAHSVQQIYVFDSVLLKSTLVSIDSANVGGSTGESSQPSISADGRKVAFASTPGGLTSTPNNGFEQVYLRDMPTSVTTMVSLQASVTPPRGGAEDSFAPDISADGDYVGFTSFSVSMSSTTTVGDRGQTYLRAVGAVVPTPTPTPTATAGTTTPVPSNSAGSSVGSGQGGGAAYLASTGRNQTPMIVGGAVAAALALVGGSVAWGARTARRRRKAGAAGSGAPEGEAE